MSAEGSWSQLCLKHWCAAVDHPIGCMLPKGTKVDLSLRLPRVRQCTLSKTGLTSSISHTSALCLQNWSFCPMTFMFGLPLQLRGSMSCHFVCSLSITSCYLLLYSPSLATVLLLHVKQCDESLPPGCLGIPAPYCARAFPLICIIFGLSLHLSPVCILTLVFIELPCTFQ